VAWREAAKRWASPGVVRLGGPLRSHAMRVVEPPREARLVVTEQIKAPVAGLPSSDVSIQVRGAALEASCRPLVRRSPH
jgi:hypothetical protein